MNRLIISYVLVLVCGTCIAQDLSLWRNQTTEPAADPAYLMWFTHTNKHYSLDARMGFDAKNTLGVYVGPKPIGTDTLWFIPEVGVLLGEQNGFGPELLAGGKFRRLDYFAFNQYAFGVNAANYFYTFEQLLISTGRGVHFGAGAQMFWLSPGQEKFPGFDIGPEIKIELGNCYVKPWYTLNLVSDVQKLIIGVGYTW